MSGNFLPAARKLVFLGEAGCGKSEIAMQLAMTLAAQGNAVHFFDLDQTKPLMRARDAAALLDAYGVEEVPIGELDLTPGLIERARAERGDAPLA